MLHRADWCALAACWLGPHLPVVAVHEFAARLQDGCEEVAVAVLVLQQKTLVLGFKKGVCSPEGSVCRAIAAEAP
jgi:hypothetical protein